MRHRDLSMTGSSDRGMALIAVLWITSLLALMAAGIGASGRTATKAAFNTLENTKARLSADAAVQKAIFDLLITGGRQPWPADGALDYGIELGGARMRIQVRDEDGKIDVNAAGLELLEGLLRAVGVNEEQAVSLAARIGDFRDDDHDLTPFGAEDADYAAAGHPYGAADRPFRTVAELRHVLGMSDAIYERVRPHLTVYSDAEGVDAFRASKIVLNALPGMTPEALEAVLAAAAATGDDPLLALPLDLVEPFEDYLLPSRELIFEVRSLGESEAGGRFVREAIVALDGGQDDLPFTFYSWQRGFPGNDF